METKKNLLKLAFSGSKVGRIKEIEELIKDRNYKRVIEPFGGSCCISNNLKYHDLIKEAVANDYDQYFKDFDKHLTYKEQLVKKLIDLGFVKSKNYLPKDKQVSLQRLIVDIQDNKSMLKYLAKNFVFSAKRSSGVLNIKDFKYFTNELSTEQDRFFYENLNNIQLDSLDYKDFIKKYVQPEDRNTLIVLDPPYLNSAQKQYNNETFFGLCETIQLLNLMKQLQNDFIFFNMVEKDSIELLNLFGFSYVYQTKRVSVSGKNHREDFMAYVTFDDQNKIFNPCLN
ncbi:hypothetical protein ETU08_01695 [Apibacter muscae]|uniref:DNA adenine methylase n=1 Tax=Apibacter muscae TaxID=2509004 RepID=UPI0011ACBA36|nr:DNA adenine methylase [Apibacter muscae]TWP31218.1 hypothetical protein ETU08_01695 [Apibacter muscae]